MSNLSAYAVWRVKENIDIKKDDLTCFYPGGFTFTHKSGNNISFDFLNHTGEYIYEDKLLDFNLYNLEEEFVTESLEADKLQEYIPVEYDIDFFKDGKMDFTNNSDEMFCTMDLIIDGVETPEVNFEKHVEPVYFKIFDGNDNFVELCNKLTESEYKKYMG